MHYNLHFGVNSEVENSPRTTASFRFGSRRYPSKIYAGYDRVRHGRQDMLGFHRQGFRLRGDVTQHMVHFSGSKKVVP
jgi:hypothetical protein